MQGRSQDELMLEWEIRQYSQTWVIPMVPLVPAKYPLNLKKSESREYPDNKTTLAVLPDFAT